MNYGYDEREAAFMLVTEGARRRGPVERPEENERVDASKRLREALIALSGPCGWDFRPHPDDNNGRALLASLHGREVAFATIITTATGVSINRENSLNFTNATVKVPLLWNPLTKNWESEEPSKFFVGHSGEPHPRRSALAIAVDHLLKFAPQAST